jgi:hypothetical protein
MSFQNHPRDLLGGGAGPYRMDISGGLSNAEALPDAPIPGSWESDRTGLDQEDEGGSAQPAEQCQLD